jgi:hypothetical protein
MPNWRKLAIKSATPEQKQQAERQLWRIFTIQCAVFFSFNPETSRLQYAVRAIIYPKCSGTRGAKGTVVLLRAGIDKGAQLDWRGHRCKKSGALAGDNPIELLLLFGLDCN